MKRAVTKERRNWAMFATAAVLAFSVSTAGAQQRPNTSPPAAVLGPYNTYNAYNGYDFLSSPLSGVFGFQSVNPFLAQPITADYFQNANGALSGSFVMLGATGVVSANGFIPLGGFVPPPPAGYFNGADNGYPNGGYNGDQNTGNAVNRVNGASANGSAAPENGAGSSAINGDAADMPVVPQKPVVVRRAPYGRVDISFRGDTTGVSRITAMLLDGSRRELTRQVLTGPPAQARLPRLAGAKYYRVRLEYPNGATRSYTGRL